MTVHGALVKCVLCVLIYLTACFLLLKLKESYESVQLINVSRAARSGRSRGCRVTDGPATVRRKSASEEIRMLERDELNGQSINFKESARILRRIPEVCGRYKLKTPLTKRHFLHDPRHKSLYCWIRKVASTSFTKLFADMRGHQVSRDYYKEVDSLSPRSYAELESAVGDNNTFKLLIVRHPFQRLVSSYRDRIEDNSKYTAQAWIYAKRIFNLTRPQLLRSRTNRNFQQKAFTRDKRLRIVPSFKEFVEWLLRYDEEDVHWSRYHEHCSVCNVGYNYVLRLDDYSYGEVNYVLGKLGLDRNAVYLSRLEEARGGYTSFAVTCKYLGTLTRQTILRLYERYRIDFEMYDYKLNGYLFCADRKS